MISFKSLFSVFLFYFHFSVHKLGEVTVALGRTVAPHIREQGGKLLPKSLKGEESSAAFEGVIEVATSGLQGE